MVTDKVMEENLAEIIQILCAALRRHTRLRGTPLYNPSTQADLGEQRVQG